MHNPLVALYAADGELMPIPRDRHKALVMQQERKGQLFCPTSLGGCGERLTIAAGTLISPYARHYAHSECGFARSESSATHGLIQRALLEWALAYSYEARLEVRTYDGRGRSDVVFDKDGSRHLVEVQLSPITPEELLRRNDLYSRFGDTVTWLFGSKVHSIPAQIASVQLRDYDMRDDSLSHEDLLVSVGGKSLTSLQFFSPDMLITDAQNAVPKRYRKQPSKKLPIDGRVVLDDPELNFGEFPMIRQLSH